MPLSFYPSIAMSFATQPPTIMRPEMGNPSIRMPLFSHKVAAGFPSPADDYIESWLNLNEYLVRHQEATFFVRAKGNSMVGAGIFDGNLLVVDKSLIPSSGSIVIAVIDSELTVKRLLKDNGKIILKSENSRFKDIELKEGQELKVWGVVTATVRKFV
jgi:DNA polymerase V